MMQPFTLQSWFGGLVRRTWIVTAITVISCAAFAAHATTSLVEADYLAPSAHGGASSPEAALPAHPAPPAAHPLRATANQLVERNMFCSSCAPASAPGPADSPSLQAAVLIETSLGREPRATVRVLASEVQGSWGLGDTIPGLGAVDRISPTWIEVVDGAGHRGRLSLRELVAGHDPGTPTPTPSAPTNPWADRIKKLDDQNYEVDRTLVRELVTSASKPGGMRFMPMLDHGQIKGVKILGVKEDSIPFALGLKTSDSLEAIDGAPLKDANQLLDLYARLDQLSAVELSGTRAGKPLVRTLRLR
jgi:hypothetical protein